MPVVAHWAISWRLISLGARERRGVGGGLRVGAQDGGLAHLEHQDADREQGEHDDQQARQDLSAFPLAHRDTER